VIAAARHRRCGHRDGGLFAHAVIVAREFGITPVDGAIADGTPISVDGTVGMSS
jgi:hypothetical protein